mmetsp:Transcript_27268/g.59617  ORF Transcript_27268/g.59617 Transcript_27268/m.59617 type:complete len:523 (-) Transcript_27268:320-1888(-)|eukprot:CAMPEP_0202922890 /NCGR_PEP_ID=MMETSP1392-20130828/78158_1 /ASSEMBLY_ACC=CAM_ASM_000868 /TAXON_ID=225041 /ORGANISM="Chlamydomonas chlamydogama, Strain SAG 11-48b" /LENGTH=522 /DNA_ID=CAMNT_0049616543 /DNA_START=77 /DNA_END=1645 /DNA_ORIENTATION=+
MDLPAEPGPGSAKDPERFYCPFPGCNRSFAELWRLKVHYRAPPDIRGSGKERGHGTELTHCPKCGKALKPGKHHVGCSGGKTTPRQGSKRSKQGDGQDLEDEGPGPSRQHRESSEQGEGQLVLAQAQSMPVPNSAPQPLTTAYSWPNGQVPGVPVLGYEQYSSAPPNCDPQQILMAPAPPDLGALNPWQERPAPASQPQPGFPQAYQLPVQPVQHQPAPPQMVFVAPMSNPAPNMQAPLPTVLQYPLSAHPNVMDFQPPVLSINQSAISGGLQMSSSSTDFLGGIFDDDLEFTRMPSPPPLPADFHMTSAPANSGLLFNFSQFAHKMPAAQPSLAGRNKLVEDLSEEAVDLAEANVVYDAHDDGDLMQMLFGVADEMPTMATIHLHQFRGTEEEEEDRGGQRSHAASHAGQHTAGPGDSSMTKHQPMHAPKAHAGAPTNGKRPHIPNGLHGPSADSLGHDGKGSAQLLPLNGTLTHSLDDLHAVKSEHVSSLHYMDKATSDALAHRDHLLDAETFQLLQSVE